MNAAVTMGVIVVVAAAWSTYLGYTEFFLDHRGKVADRNNDDRRNLIEAVLAIVAAVIGFALFFEQAVWFAFDNLPADTSEGWVPMLMLGEFFVAAVVLFGLFMGLDWLAGTIHLGLFQRNERWKRKKRFQEEQERREYEREKEKLQKSRIWRNLLKLTELPS